MTRTPLKAIRAKCLDCQGGSWKLVAGCLSHSCPLWPYRLGKNPARKGIGGNPALKKELKICKHFMEYENGICSHVQGCENERLKCCLNCQSNRCNSRCGLSKEPA